MVAAFPVGFLVSFALFSLRRLYGDRFPSVVCRCLLCFRFVVGVVALFPTGFGAVFCFAFAASSVWWPFFMWNLFLLLRSRCDIGVAAIFSVYFVVC